MVSKEEFEEYERIRMSGVANMFNLKLVEQISNLNRDTILDIMQNYELYNERYRK